MIVNRSPNALRGTTAAMLRCLTLGATWLVAVVCPTVQTLADDVRDGLGESGPTATQRRLVQQLGDASIVVREDAAGELAGQGSAAKGVLTEALIDKDAEIRWRARLLLNRMLQAVPAEDTVDQAADLGASAAQRELIQQLGDRSFFTRERASAELARQGAAAQAVLTEALKSSDLEIRFRARRILNRVLQERFEAQLTAFIGSVDGTQQHGLPGWKRFRDLVGEGRDARKMFVAMTRHEGALLSAYEKQLPELPEWFAARVGSLRRQAASRNSDPPVLSRLSLATLLLIGCDKTVKDHSPGVSQLYQLLCQRAVMQSIGTREQPPFLRTLLDKWATNAASGGSYYGMSLMLKYNLKEAGLQQAKKVLEGATTSSSLPRYAIIIVGRFGGDEHGRLLTPQLANKKVCNRWSNRAIKKNGTIDTQVRDVALVVLLRLSGKDPKQYGFKLLKENPETLYHAYTFGFVNDEEREAAHAKWAAESKDDAVPHP